MAKRNGVVVLSSDDEDVKSSSRSRSGPRPKLKSVPTRSDPRGAKKKPRLAGPRSRSCKQSGTVDEFEFFGEDFKQVFTGVKVSAGFGKDASKELWVDRYKPCTFEDLAVHKKKVEEVKSWFEGRLQAPKDNYGSNVLLITGQAGAGKSATVRVIASHVRAMLFEWNTPTPTIWQEHIYGSNTGAQYISKLDEFEHFIETIRKFRTLSGRPSSPVVVLIDDLPLTFGRSAYKRLQNCLHLLVQTACTPTVILISDTGQSDSADDPARSLDELQSFLEKAGAYKISFNPITNKSIKRSLSRICREERCDVNEKQLDLIATASGGDIRQAITSLQFLCLDEDIRPASLISDSALKNGQNLPGDKLFVQFGRDETLSLFHALGKFLHNKRECESTSSLDEGKLPIRDKYLRLPLKMDSPEKVLGQAHGQARPIAEFLHENALDFLDEDAIDDAWTMLSYLGDADILLDTLRRNFAKNSDIEGILQSCAASVAVRGVLFGNDHPLPPRWHSIRKPKLWQVQKLALNNKDELLRQRDEYHGSSDLSVIATEYTPVHRWIQHKQPDVHQGSVLDCGTGDGDEDTTMEDQEADPSDGDDEIEDW
ncbi:hypothetical protein CDL15_Pgr004693 [Punica granatum]|uniref:Cell cycle checkpoint protein RAD17 n=1 Tax=Punica granatum TaxID=22663 RepID=A0A218W7N2_PUNGR|nr:hypothetical protein CDL15_Pgr004693 [Punica granatum]